MESYKFLKAAESTKVEKIGLQSAFIVDEALTPELYVDTLAGDYKLPKGVIVVLKGADGSEAVLGDGELTWLDGIKLGGGGAPAAVNWDDIEDKPTTFAPAAHTHTIAQVTALQAALDGKQASGNYATAAQGALADTATQPADLATGLATKADTSHTQAFTTITGVATVAQVPSLPTSKITSGTFAIAQTNSVLAGLGEGTNEAVVATDTLLVAIAKLQAQITALTP